MYFLFSQHAKEQMQLRQIEESWVNLALSNPDKIVEQDNEIRVYQKMINFEHRSNFLLRVFVNIIKNPPQIVTVYLTSKLEKYR